MITITGSAQLLRNLSTRFRHCQHCCQQRRFAFKPQLTFTSRLKPGKNAWILTSQNIFENLALEDWLYKHEGFHDKSLLLLWRNTPCVVIGRHQNPWAELDVAMAMKERIRVARRNSGGGTVYHDLGNLCVSVFTSRGLYDRKRNLELVRAALRREFPSLHVSINDRDDLMLNTHYKISGTAAKLGGKVAYHHFTLLIDVDKSAVRSVLKPTMAGLQSNATESVPADVINLRDVDASVTYERVCDAIARKYFSDCDAKEVVQHVNPRDDHVFPEISSCLEAVSSWEWVYGKTPSFNVKRDFHGLMGHRSMTLDLHFEVQKGLIHNVALQLTGCDDAAITAAIFSDALRGTRFCWDAVDDVIKRIHDDKELFRKCDDFGYAWIALCLNEVFK